MLFFVGDGPHRKKAEAFQWNAFAEIFQSKKWRQAAFGYFGHMWELYTYWGFLPAILALYAEKNNQPLNIPLLSFLIIGCGSISCITGGYLSLKFGSAKVATTALLVSGICCFISPFIYNLPLFAFLAILFIWGLAVIPDSPQFSTLVANYAPNHLKGTALKIYNAIGFAISTISLVVIDRIFHSTGFFAKENTMLLLGIGALVGLPSMFRLVRSK
jgi:predicted MFS family arabinose efflux permease